MEETSFLFCITSFTFLVIFLFCYIRHVFTYFERNQMATISTIPSFPFGHISDVIFKNQTTLNQFLMKTHNKIERKRYKFGGVYFLLKPALVIVEAKFINQDGGTNFRDINQEISCTFFDPKINLNFHPRYKDNNSSLTDKMIVDLNKYLTNSRDVDLNKIFLDYFVEISKQDLFGLENNDEKFLQISKQFMNKTFDLSFKKILSVCNYLDAKNLIKNETTFFKQIIENVMKHRKKTDKKKSDFIQTLTGINLNSDEITNAVLDFFLINLSLIDTLVFCLYELSINKEIQDELRGEIVRFAKEGLELNSKNLAKLSYLETVIQETFRKYPPVPFISKISLKQFGNESHKIPKDCLIFFSIYAVHYNPKYYTNPDLFDPDRFSEENRQFIEPLTYLPFGLSSSSTTKLNFASLQMKVVLISILKQFKISLGNNNKKLITFDECSVKLRAKNVNKLLKLELI